VFVTICVRLSVTVFYARRANISKMRTFRGYPSFAPLFVEKPFTQRREILSKKLEFLRQPQRKFRDSSLHRFDTDYECDRQTDRRIDYG